MREIYQYEFAEVRAGLPSPSRISIADLHVSICEGWRPDPDEEFWPETGGAGDSVEWFKLKELAENELLNIRLVPALYSVRRIGENTLKLWCSAGGWKRQNIPLIGEIENLGVCDNSPFSAASPEVDFYFGVVAVHSGAAPSSMMMPYFAFDMQGRLQKPVDARADGVNSIHIARIK